jgi:predicted Rossmann fold flavoprotein
VGEAVVVVGAGAAGLMAAGYAAELGAPVLLVEKTARPGNKLRLTGNGRCNLTHAGDVADFIAHVVPDGSFLRNSLARFFVPELRAFVRALGVPTATEADGRVFPATYRAEDVVAALEGYCEAQGVEFRYESPVAEILVGGGQVRCVRLEDGTRIPAQQVILATGGLSYPQTGSTGDGYRMARAVGHTIVSTRPGLVPLVTREEFVPRLQGLSLADVGATLYHGEKAIASGRGGVLFTHFGVSGPLVLSLSLHLGDERVEGPLRLCLDLQPTLNATQLEQRLQHDLASMGRTRYHTLVRGMLPRALTEVFVQQSGISGEQCLNQITTEQRRCVSQLFKCFPLTILRTRPIREAMVTLGGVDVAEVDPRSMQSRLVRGLYLVGEVLNLAGDTGGYNLQIAFTTGRMAGESAARAWEMNETA